MNAKLPEAAVDLAHLTAQLGWGKGEGGGSCSPDVDIPQATAPPISEGVGRTWGEGGGGHMCKLSTSPPSHCELTLITADRQARPLWLDTHCKLATHYAAYPFTPMNTPRTRNKNKDKERDKDKNKDNDGLFILRHKISKKGKAYQESCENSRKQKRMRITTELTNLKFLYWECQDNTRQRNEFLDNGTRKRENLGL